MIFNIVFAIVILLQMVFVGYLVYMHQQEREKLLKMFMAKDLREVTDNEALEKIPDQPFIKPPDLASMDEAADDEKLFDRHVAAVKAQAREELKKEVEITLHIPQSP